jgi:hypothetical protein
LLLSLSLVNNSYRSLLVIVETLNRMHLTVIVKAVSLLCSFRAAYPLYASSKLKIALYESIKFQTERFHFRCWESSRTDDFMTDKDPLSIQSDVKNNFQPGRDEGLIDSKIVVDSEKSINSAREGPILAPDSISFWLLNSVAVIWGSQHVVIKSSLSTFVSPAVLNFWRFAMSAALFSPALISLLVCS